MKTRHVLSLLAIWVMMVSGSLGAAAPGASQQRVCQRLVKVDTVADHDDQFSKDWAKDAAVTRQPDGSIIVADTRLKSPTTWQIWLDKGKAIHTNQDPGGSAEVTWTIPPPILCSDQDFTLSLTANLTSGEDWAAANFGTSPVEIFQSGGTIVGANPYGAIQAWGLSAPSMSGSITQRPKACECGDWTLWVYLRTSGAFNGVWIHYHYTHIPAGQEPPVGPSPTFGAPPTTGPQPPVGLGATNTVLPTPPYGTPEPNPNVPGMTLQAGQRRVPAGGLVLVPVWLIKGDNVANLNFDVRYDANVARPEETIQSGNLLDQALFSANPNESGIVRVGFAQTSGVFGTGTVALIPFRAVGQPGDRTPLTLAVTTINNPNGAVPAIDRIHGEIVIVGPDGLVPGDCDGDGRLTVADALCALEISVGLRPPNTVLDLDGSGDATSRDAVLILQQALTSIIR